MASGSALWREFAEGSVYGLQKTGREPSAYQDVLSCHLDKTAAPCSFDSRSFASFHDKALRSQQFFSLLSALALQQVGIAMPARVQS